MLDFWIEILTRSQLLLPLYTKWCHRLVSSQFLAAFNGTCWPQSLRWQWREKNDSNAQSLIWNQLVYHLTDSRVVRDLRLELRKKPLLRRADLPIFLIPDGVASGIRAHVSEFTTQSLRLLDHSHNFPQLGFEPRFAPSKGAVLPVRRPRSISAQLLTAQSSPVRIASKQGSIAPIRLVQ